MPEKKKKYLTRDQRDNRTAWIMLAPALLFLAVMIAYPLGKVIHDAFSQVNLIKPNVSGFAGLDNFKTILNDEHFWNDAKNTVIWTVCSVAGEYIVGMLAAVLLNQKFKGRAIFRTCVFIPWLVPIIVAGMTWDWMLNTDFGIVNYLLTHLHIVQAPINFLGDARFAMATVIFVNIWRSFPYYTISFLAAMQSIPGDLSEAAAIDGAGMFTRFFRITLPLISPMIVYLVITGFVGIAGHRIHPCHLDRDQLRLYLGHDRGRPELRYRNAADHDLSLFDEKVQCRRSVRAVYHDVYGHDDPVRILLPQTRKNQQPGRLRKGRKKWAVKKQGRLFPPLPTF